MSSTPQQPTTPQPTATKTPTDTGAAIVEPPPPHTKTVIVTTQPELIPDESSTVFCLTRRNIIDAIVAIILAAGIIYLVISWRRATPATGFATSTSFGMPPARGIGTNTGISGIGQQIKGIGQNITGGVKKFMKSMFK